MSDDRRRAGIVALGAAEAMGVEVPNPLQVLDVKPEWRRCRRFRHRDSLGRRIAPNALCPCGSGRKYKRCHGKGL